MTDNNSPQYHCEMAVYGIASAIDNAERLAHRYPMLMAEEVALLEEAADALVGIVMFLQKD